MGKGSWGALSSERLNHLKRYRWPIGSDLLLLHIYMYVYIYIYFLDEAALVFYFYKPLCAPLRSAQIPRQAPVCDPGPGWTFLRWSLALVQISGCVGFGTSRRQKPHHPAGLQRPLSCPIQNPLALLEDMVWLPPEPEVIWGRPSIHP